MSLAVVAGMKKTEWPRRTDKSRTLKKKKKKKEYGYIKVALNKEAFRSLSYLSIEYLEVDS